MRRSQSPQSPNQALKLSPSMEKEVHDWHNIKQTKDIPNVLLIGPLVNLPFFKPKNPEKYNLSKPWNASSSSSSSPLPLHHFMAENHYDPSMFKALICSPTGPPISDHVLQLLPCVKLVVTTSSGTDHIDLSECRRRGIQVANVGSLFSQDVADMATALLIGVLTKISAADRFLRTQMQCGIREIPHCYNSKLCGKRVGIVGLGSIGIEVAKRLEAFGCIILYFSRNKKPLVPYPFYSNMVKLAATSDALVLCCALNEQTKHIVNKEVMLALGNRGVIVNVGRGSLIDEEELVKCLMEGDVGGAGLDVFENEPNVPQELLAMDNVILSPHTAGFTTETYIGTAELVAENLEAFFSNKPLITPIKFD